MILIKLYCNVCIKGKPLRSLRSLMLGGGFFALLLHNINFIKNENSGSE